MINRDLNPKVKSLLIGFVGAILGVLFILVLIHLYQDHQNLHALVNWAPVVEQRLKK